ncbi:cation efflux family-domain-containing protein [Xylaria sp. CBS 124048]|nr:cation efflux family-domain-containing protein [Xylaria sp. CBS 124048]
MLALCRPRLGRPHQCFAGSRSRWTSSTLPQHANTATFITGCYPRHDQHIQGRPQFGQQLGHQGSRPRTHRPQPQLSVRVPLRRIIQTSSTSAPASSSAITSPSTTHSPYSRSLLRSPPTTMGSVTQTRPHSGHHHGHHHHHHDNVYLTSQNKNDAGVRVTRIGLYSNLGMAVAKGVGGYVFNSQAMIADAIHSVTDLASDILTLTTLSWSLKSPTDKFPTGFGKVESLGSLGVSSMLLFGGMWMGYGSLLTLYGHFFLDPAAAAELAMHAHGHGHSHGHDHGSAIPSLHAAWLAAGTVAVKEWLYQATMKVARDRKSSVLASNAIHHRIDSLTGIVTLAAILGANLFQHAAWLDPIGGLLISLMVVKAGAENTLAAIFELADRSIDDDVKASIRKQVQKVFVDMKIGDKIELRDVSGIKSGQNYLVDLEVAVPGNWSIEEVREVEEDIRTKVGNKVRGVRKVRVRFLPKEDTAVPKFDEFIPGDVSPKSSPEPEDDDNHRHNGNGPHDKSK